MKNWTIVLWQVVLFGVCRGLNRHCCVIWKSFGAKYQPRRQSLSPSAWKWYQPVEPLVKGYVNLGEHNTPRIKSHVQQWWYFTNRCLVDWCYIFFLVRFQPPLFIYLEFLTINPHNTFKASNPTFHDSIYFIQGFWLEARDFWKCSSASDGGDQRLQSSLSCSEVHHQFPEETQWPTVHSLRSVWQTAVKQLLHTQTNARILWSSSILSAIAHLP